MNKRILSFASAFLLYSIFAVWLLLPHKNKLTGCENIFYAFPVIASLGVFMLTRRYAASFFAGLAGGAVYGFGSFACSFLCFHPFASLVYAFLPWSFLPAAFIYKYLTTGEKTTGFISACLSLLPFLFFIGCFAGAAHFYLFPIPTGSAISAKNFVAILNPARVSADSFSLGFYHAPLGAIAIGAVLFCKTRRYWIAILSAIAIFLCFYKPILNIPPVLWISFPVLIYSVAIASGLEALILSGKADSLWLLLAPAVLILQAGLTILLGKGEDLSLSNSLSGVSVAAVMLIFFIARAGLSLRFLRVIILYAAVFLDIIVITRNLISAIF
ncbi:MAG: hypothetical protein ACYC54_11705 [Sedimentisphaerales bacterium]